MSAAANSSSKSSQQLQQQQEDVNLQANWLIHIQPLLNAMETFFKGSHSIPCIINKNRNHQIELNYPKFVIDIPAEWLTLP